MGGEMGMISSPSPQPEYQNKDSRKINISLGDDMIWRLFARVIPWSSVAALCGAAFLCSKNPQISLGDYCFFEYLCNFHDFSEISTCRFMCFFCFLMQSRECDPRDRYSDIGLAWCSSTSREISYTIWVKSESFTWCIFEGLFPWIEDVFFLSLSIHRESVMGGDIFSYTFCWDRLSSGIYFQMMPWRMVLSTHSHDTVRWTILGVDIFLENEPLSRGVIHLRMHRLYHRMRFIE